jgi:hypothetical protein
MFVTGKHAFYWSGTLKLLYIHRRGNMLLRSPERPRNKNTRGPHPKAYHHVVWVDRSNFTEVLSKFNYSFLVVFCFDPSTFKLKIILSLVVGTR